MTHRVQVTAEDIAMGVRSSGSCCPVARAISRSLGRGVNVLEYGERRLHVIAQNYQSIDDDVPLAKEVERWIRRYDQGIGSPEPFSFEIDVV